MVEFGEGRGGRFPKYSSEIVNRVFTIIEKLPKHHVLSQKNFVSDPNCGHGF